MPRPLRIKKQNIVYHIESEPYPPQWPDYQAEITSIFHETFERLERLGYEFEILSFQTTPQDYKLKVIPRNETPIDRLMQQINSVTARRLNRLFGHCGPFWKQRYKSELEPQTLDRVPKHCQL